MRTTAVVMGALVALAVSGCGSSKDSGHPAAAPTTKEYCAAVRAISGTHRPAPRQLVARVQRIGDNAPPEVAAAWHDIATATITYAGAVQRTLLDPSHPPVGLTPAKTRAVNERLLATAYRTNFRNIGPQVRKVQRHVRATCGFGTSL